jgi:uncharacterized protein (TIGR00369 family)
MADDKPTGGAPGGQLPRGLRGFSEAIPHNRALGIEALELAPSSALLRLRYDGKLVGNPETGVLHGGAITALLDAASGTAVFAALTEWLPMATLDLRIDYLRAADAGRDVLARAVCYRLARHVAFTRAVAYIDDERDPIASAVGTFMLGTKPGSHGKLA